MFGFLTKIRKKRLSFEHLQMVQFLAQQVVLSMEGSINLPGARKKALALELMAKILEEMNLVAPESLVDACLESAVSILKALDLTPKTASDSERSSRIQSRRGLSL